MDISGLGVSKLLEALERLGVSPGADLRSPEGPQGRPAPDVVRAFEEALKDGPSETQAAAPAETALPGPAQAMPSPAEAEGLSAGPVSSVPEADAARMKVHGAGETHPAEDLSRTGGPENKAERSESDVLRDVARLMERVGSGGASMTDLYRLQYMVGILRLQASGGSHLSQQVNQGFESLLKQQG